MECKWIFKVQKSVSKDAQPRYNTRLVAKGYTQREWIYYTEILSPVVKFKTIRLMLSLAACQDLELGQLDVKTTFLHRGLEEVIYMTQPEGFLDSSKPHHVCLPVWSEVES